MGKKKKPRQDWISTAIPRALAERVREEILGKGDYSSLTDFIAEAVRLRLEDLKTKGASR